MKPKSTLVIIEDHPLIRTALKSLIVESGEFEILAEAGSLAEGRALLQSFSPNLVLLDVSLPDGSGFEILKENFLKKNTPSESSTKFVMLTMHRETPYLTKARELGASGYVVKDMAPESLVETIHQVLEGHPSFMAPTLAQADLDKAHLKMDQKLSPREQKVKELLVDGVSLTEIGKALGVSVKTVSTYRTRILAKLGLTNNAELVRYDMRSSPDL